MSTIRHRAKREKSYDTGSEDELCKKNCSDMQEHIAFDI